MVTETLPGSQVGLTIEVPAEEVDAAYERVLERLGRRVKIGGFRPGKAPRGLIEARVGEAALREEVIDALVPGVVGQALRDGSIDPIDRPRVDVVEIQRGRPGRLVARVSVMPEVTLPDLGALRVPAQKTDVTDAMVEARLLELLERLAEITPVEREVREGDVVVADLEVLVDGAAVESEARKATEVEVKEGRLVPELLAVLPGRSEGETAEAQVSLPQDHPEESLAGRPATLRMTVRGVKEKRLPELDAELASRLSEGEASTPQELRGVVRRDLEAAAVRVDELRREREVLDLVVEGSSVEVPPALVDHELEHMLESLGERLSRQGLRLDAYLKYLGMTAEEWVEKARPEAEGRIKVDLVLEEVTRRQGIQPSEEEVAAFVKEQAASDPGLQDKLDEILAGAPARELYTHRLRRLETLRWLVGAAGAGEAAAPAQGEPSPPATLAGEDAGGRA